MPVAECSPQEPLSWDSTRITLQAFPVVAEPRVVHFLVLMAVIPVLATLRVMLFVLLGVAKYLKFIFLQKTNWGSTRHD